MGLSVVRHAECVKVADSGISIYSTTLVAGCGFSNDERVLFLNTGMLSLKETLIDMSCWSDAEEILGVHRSMRRWIFNAAATG